MTIIDDNNEARKMTFGKHDGKGINLLPPEYLLWALSQDWMRDKYPTLTEALDEELRQRYLRGRRL